MIIYFEGKTMENHFTDSRQGQLVIIVYFITRAGVVYYPKPLMF